MLNQHDDAVGSYELARTALLRSAPDPQQHCRIVLGLAAAQLRAGHKPEARANFAQAAELARQIGVPELLAQSALGYGDARSWGETGVVNDTLVGLLEESLSNLRHGQDGLRARLQARLAEELYHLGTDQRRAHIRGAVAAARRSRNPVVLAQVLLSRRFALWTPENLAQRRNDATQAVELARKAHAPEIAALGIGWLIGDLLELGLIVEAELQIQALAKLVEQLRQPALRSHELRVRSMRAAMIGRFDDAERLATEALRIGIALQDADAPLLFGVQMFTLRRLQGRLDEVEPTARAFADSLQNVWMWRVALASISAELGRVSAARHEFDFLACNDFSGVARDAHWLSGVAMLAEVCAFLGYAARAAILYELLAPFSARHIIGVPGIVSAGSASYYLGLLASTMGQWSAAVRHFEAALKMNKALQAVPHVAQTEQALAAALLGRSQATDAEEAARLLASAIATYERLGMQAHLARALALRDWKSSPSTPPAESSIPIFLAEGEEWSVTWQRKTFRVKHVRGLSVIAHLIRHPGRRFHVTELAPVADGITHIGESTTAKGLTAQQRDSLRWQSFWRELHRLEFETGSAERRGDRAGMRTFRRKMRLMRRQLEQCSDEVERLRKRISGSLARAFRVIGQNDRLREHLGCTIDRGLKEVAYNPDSDKKLQEPS